MSKKVFFSLGLSVLAVICSPSVCSWGHTHVRYYWGVDSFKLLHLAQLYKQWLLGINWFSVCSLTSREAPESVPGSRVVEDRVSQKVNQQNEAIPWKIWHFCLPSWIWAALREGHCFGEETPVPALAEIPPHPSWRKIPFVLSIDTICFPFVPRERDY